MIQKIKKSIGTKIIILILFIVLGLGAVALILWSSIALGTVSTYYESICSVFMAYTKQCIASYQEKSYFEDVNRLVAEFEKLCEEEIVDLAVVTIRAADDENTGLALMRIKKDEIKLIGDSDFDARYELEAYEKDVLSGVTDYAYGKYVSNHWGNVVEICKAFDYNGKNDEIKRVMVGLVLKQETILKRMGSLLLNSVTILLGIVILTVMILAVMLRYLIVQPITKISSSMRKFVENDKLECSKLDVRGSDEIAQMAEDFNFMTNEIKKYVEQVRKYEGIQQKNKVELSIASQIQQGLLPAEIYSCDSLSVRGMMLPARNVGGDFYFYERIDDERFAFAIGDVSGKGISAAMFMANAAASIKYNLRMYQKPSKVLQMVNQNICNENPEQFFVTIFVGVLDVKSKVLTYSNAGHNPPYLISDEAKNLSEARGVLIGLFEDELYEDAQITIGEDDYIFMYTDGVTEAVNSQGGFFGTERLVEILNRKHSDVIHEVLDEIRHFTGGVQQNDDITMLGVRLKNNKKLLISAKAESIREVKDFILSNDKMEEQFKRKLYLAAEELFVNIYSYGYPDGKPGIVEISLDVSEKDVTMVFKDDAAAFNPLEDVRESDSFDPDLEIGGLGRLLAFHIMDESHYEYRNDKNILTMKKYF